MVSASLVLNSGIKQSALRGLFIIVIEQLRYRSLDTEWWSPVCNTTARFSLLQGGSICTPACSTMKA
jgi:hypothetical protein